MSLTGEAIFYVEQRPAKLKQAVENVMAQFGASGLSGVSAYKCAPQPILRQGDDWVFDDKYFYDPPASRYIKENHDATMFVECLSMYEVVYTSLRSPSNGNLINAIRRSIPETVSGGAWVGSPSLCIGPTHWYEEIPTLEPGVRYFGKSEFAVVLSGYGTPNDWEAYRNLIFEIPEFKAIQAGLEAFLGPVKRCITWSS